MLRISARKVANITIDECWDTLTGEFILVFDDGEIKTNYKETIYSRFFWEFHNSSPSTPLLIKHHVQSVLNGKRASMSTHLKLMNVVLWDTYDHNVSNLEVNNVAMQEYALSYRYMLAEMAYGVMNNLYNYAVTRLGEYATGTDIVDMLEVFDSKPVQECFDRAEPNEAWIKDIYTTIDNFLTNDPSIRKNTMSKQYRSDLVNKQQVHQTLGVRGFVDALDNIRFNYPIMRGYFQGIRTVHDYIVEPQTAAMSLNSSKGSLQDTEYFSRKLQIMAMSVQRMHFGDCGSTKYLPVYIKPKTDTYKGSLVEMLGVNFLDEETGKIRPITLKDTHLEGKVVLTRNVIYCKHPDTNGVCSTCYGQLSEVIPKNSNFGHINCVYMTEQSGQAVLSTKHLARSSVVEGAVVEKEFESYIKAGPDNNSYMFTKLVQAKSKQNKAILRISISDAPNLTDIAKINEIRGIQVNRFSEMEKIVLIIDDVPIVINVGEPKLKASISHELLKYMNRKGLKRVENDVYYEVDLDEWDFNEVFAVLPLRNFSMADHAKDIAYILESSVTEAIDRDRFMDPAKVLIDLFELVNSKLSVNLSVISVVFYSVLIRSAEHFNYGLVKTNTESGLGVLKNVMMYRSGAAYMSYERHSEFIENPESYMLTNRVDHPMDIIFMPAEVQHYESKTKPVTYVSALTNSNT